MTLPARAAALAAELSRSRIITPTLTDDAATLTVTLDEAAILAALEDVRREALREARHISEARDKWLDQYNGIQLQRYEMLYEQLSRAECRRQGIDPDDIIADGGHLAWHLVGYEAAMKENNDNAIGDPPDSKRPGTPADTGPDAA